MDAKMTLGVLAIGAAAGLAGYSALKSESASAAPFQLYSTRAKLVSLEDLRGKVVVLDFWASWCPPCRAAIPRLEQIHQRYKDRGVVVLGINCSERADPAAAMQQLGATYTCLVQGDEVAQAYKVRGIPTLVVIDPARRVLFRDSGFGPATEAKIIEAVEKGLATGG